ncbi:CatB-related O-acetyltransferase [Winogradskyella sp. A2]|uniref:CatB-related O-acetyltransferase n=1 Tax=Winogradskyella sp. A2 TaxID=3366944 RepID=UPI00398C2A1D
MFIRKAINRILGFCAPELKPILTKQLKLESLSNIKIKTIQSELTNIVEPYRLINVKIAKGTYIATNSKISRTEIGRFCSIGPNLLCGWGIHPTDGISTSPYFYSTQKQNSDSLANEDLFEERKPITIGNDVFIGANVTILDGVNIGDGAIIGAGSVVSKSIPDFAIAFGNPIAINNYRFNEDQRIALKEIQWWNFNDDQLKGVNKYFFDIDTFVEKYRKK